MIDLKKLPDCSGVYMFLGKNGEVLYVGKAVNLRSRVSSYFSGKDERPQISFLLKRVRDIKYFETGTPELAAVLERDLIQKYKPVYNIKLKDNASSFLLRLDPAKAWPYFELVSSVRSDSAYYVGPFPSKTAAKKVLEALRIVFPLRSCSDFVFYNRLRPCIEYELGRCLGPCCLPVDKEHYDSLVKLALKALEGEAELVEKKLLEKISLASQDLRFEDCIYMKDLLDTFKLFANKSYVHSGEQTHYFATVCDKSTLYLGNLKALGAKLVDFSVKTFSLPPEFKQFSGTGFEEVILTYYSIERSLPSKIILDENFEINRELLKKSIKTFFNVDLEVVPPSEISELEKRLLALCVANTKHFASSSFFKRANFKKLSLELIKFLNLREVPRRVECLDISNLGSKIITAGFSVFEDGEFKVEEYLRLRLRQLKQDDFQSIKSAIRLRVKRKPELFDLLVVDGGIAQLRAAKEALAELGVERPVVSIAKKRAKTSFERIYVNERALPILLKERTLMYSFFVSLRDEAHKIANKFNAFFRSNSWRVRL